MFEMASIAMFALALSEKSAYLVDLVFAILDVLAWVAGCDAVVLVLPHAIHDIKLLV